jgi:hypothetical protein
MNPFPKIKSPRTPNDASRKLMRSAFRDASKSVTGGLEFFASFKQVHVNNSKYERRVEREFRIILSRFGAYVRTTAKNLLGRKNQRRVIDRKKVWYNGMRYHSWRYAKPGKPPKNHYGGLKNSLRFTTNVRKRNVIIQTTKIGKGSSAHLLEYGGRQRIQVNWKTSKSGRLKISKLPEDLVWRSVRYKARPYMRPAFVTTYETFLPELLRRSKLPNALKGVFKQQVGAAVERYR